MCGKRDDQPGNVFVFPAEVKTNPKTALELANADDDDD